MVKQQHDIEKIEGTALLQALGADGEVLPGPRVAIIGRMHGNEPVGDPVHERLQRVAEERLVCGSLLLVRANIAAAAANLRHTPEGSDLNRLWDRETLDRLAAADPATLSYEERRARELAPLLEQCDAVLDLHSTSRPAAPFLVFRDDQRHAAIASRMGVGHLITGLHENGILSGGAGANVGLRAGEMGKRLGFTFEAGQHDDPGNADRAWAVVERLLVELGLFERQGPVEDFGPSGVYEVVDRFRQAPAGNEQYRFVGYHGGEPGAGRRMNGPRKLHSFEEIEADEVVLRRGRSEVVRAHTPFTMLMPAPTTEPGTDLYYVTQQRHGGLTGGVPRTNTEARREALAIERMLDLLADDDFERGSTWVAFDHQRLFDLCASIIGRTLRLPVDHPHRRLVVLGRGESGRDEGERRAGHRYREAMRIAIAEGLPIERIQLLRGAQIGWIDAMTGDGMLELLRRRAERCGPHGEGIQMRVSTRQPHTASLLVAGDLERAIEAGDTRHVRVALLIEAATVEPDEGTARVRVVRSGLVSSRPEVVRAAQGLLSTLRWENRYEVRHGALREEKELRRLVAAGDGLEVRGDADELRILRDALVRAQVRLWTDQLLHELPEPVGLPDERAVGLWLAEVMSSTGIMDADGLRALAIRRDGSGFVADPERVRKGYERAHMPDEPTILPKLLPPPESNAPVGPQPQLARDLDADSLERWVGWKRFVRGVQVVPGARGHDLDLAFSAEMVRRRLTQWFESAVELGSQEPGDVMVVVAGDGLSPTRDRLSENWALFEAHRQLVLDPNVHYLRIQHASGTNLAWMKDFLAAVHQRPHHAQSVAVQFEAEHGATVNVVLVARRDRGGPPPGGWSLDGWDLLSCAVILADLEPTDETRQVALFTGAVGADDGLGHAVNQELLHFGRAHCGGLLNQAGPRALSFRGPLPTEDLEACLVDLIARWIERVRVWGQISRSAPRDIEDRGRWVARRLGLADVRLARALAREMERTGDAREAALALWDSVPPWPGPSEAVAAR